MSAFLRVRHIATCLLKKQNNKKYMAIIQSPEIQINLGRYPFVKSMTFYGYCFIFVHF